MPKGIPKNKTNKGWFAKGGKPKNGFTLGHRRGVGRKLTSNHKKKLSDAKKQLYKTRGNIIGFQKGNKWWEHANVKVHQFLVGQNKLDKHPNWNGGSSFAPYTVDWNKTLKQAIRERDKYTCQVCHEPQGDKALDVHHIDYNKKNCSPDNLISLCHRCHMKTNHKRGFWIKLFTKHE
jgi:hypothetical protein